MIPNIIHYCWFGKNPMPAKQQKYIAGWKKLMPDYTFKCWSEKNINIQSIPFALQAYEAKKFAFVADYTRIYALFHEGGIYMDTDVKLLQSFDQYLKSGVFTSYECHTSRKDIPSLARILTEEGDRKNKSVMAKVPGNGLLSAVIGAEKEHPFIKDCLDFYNNSSFQEVFDRNFTIPTVLALHAEKYGLKYIDKDQNLSGNIKIYNSGVFSDYSTSTSNSIAIHYCEGSWVSISIIMKIKSKLHHINWLRNLVNFVYPKKQK